MQSKKSPLVDSCIYEGIVRHRRFSPVKHHFTYKLFMMYLDLDELPALFDKFWFWSCENTNLAQFRRSDHIGDPNQSLKESAYDLVETHCGNRPNGPVRLLTHLRYFGYRINPVSFYYCYDKQDRNIEAIVAEINNTPWGEQYAYVLDEGSNTGEKEKKCYRLNKAFHISPFMPMNQKYRWYFTSPGKHLNVHMETYDDQSTLFDATLNLSQTLIRSATLNRVLIQYPFMTARVGTAIYWQALKLWGKRTPFYPHPNTNSKGTIREAD